MTPVCVEGEYIDLDNGKLGYVDAATGAVEVVKRKRAMVQINCHVAVAGQYYSAPCDYLGQIVEARATKARVDILDGDTIIATHTRIYGRHGQYATDMTHMPQDPRKAAWNANRFIRWASQIGPNTVSAIRGLFDRCDIEQQAYKSAMAILHLSKKYGSQNLEQACRQILAEKRYVSYTRISTYLTAMLT